jgi:predicted Zn-dependent peptidase
MEVKLDITEKVIHGIKVVHVKTSNLMSHFAFHCLSGSYHENNKNQGVSHYLEHLFFKGTDKRDYEAVSDDAALLGATQNAFTSDLDTSYYLSAPSENYDGCIELLSDMIFNSTFPEGEIEKENTVIQAERKSYEDNPQSYYFNTMEAGLFNFRFGHSIIGTEETIDNIDKEALVDFKDKFYGTNNVIFMTMTSVPAEKVFESCEDYFADNGWSEVDVTSFDEPLAVSLSDFDFKRENIQQSYLSMIYRSPEFNSDDEILEMSMRLYLSGGLYGKLGKIIREELGLCYHIGAYDLTTTPNDGMSCIFTKLDTENVIEAKSNIVKVLSEISNGDIEEGLFKCVKAQILASCCSQMDDPARISRKIAQSILFGVDVNVAEDYKKILDLNYEDFAVYLQKRAQSIIDDHSWVEMLPEEKSE